MTKKAVSTILFAGAALCLAVAAAAQQAIDQKRPASPTGIVAISNLAGSVTVKGWDKGEVAVTGTLGKGAERLEFEGSGDRTTIRVVLPEHAHNVQESTLDVHVPAGSRVEVDTVSADVDVSDVMGDLDLQTVSGNVKAAGLPRELRAQTVSGRIDSKAEASRIKAKTVSGPVIVTAKAPRDLEMESVSGEIRYEGSLAKDGSLDASTVSGGVELRLPKDLAADFTASTFSGAIENALSAQGAAEPEGHMGRHLSFSTGTGGARVSVKTFSGSIDLKKR